MIYFLNTQVLLWDVAQERKKATRKEALYGNFCIGIKSTKALPWIPKMVSFTISIPALFHMGRQPSMYAIVVSSPPTLSPFFCCLKVYYILVTTIQYITLLTRNTLFTAFKTMGTLFLFCCNICISAFPFHVVFDLKRPKAISLRHNLIKAQDQDTV